MKCKRCQSTHIVKNGKREGKQYFLCRGCNHQFILEKENHSQEEKQLAVMLYCLGLSFTAIGLMLHVHASTVMRWVRKYTDENCEKPKPTGTITIELDEMHHFIHSKKLNVGFGRLTVEQVSSLLIGN